MALRSGWWMVCCTLALVMASQAVAQGPGGDGPRGGRGRGMGRDMSGLMLLGQKSVQEELKLTEQQVGDATKAIEAQITAMQGFRDAAEGERAALIEKVRAESEKGVAAIVTPDQAKRLAQIALQVQGLRAFESETTVKALSLTEEQKSAIAKIGEEAQTERRGLFGNRDGGGGGDREGARKKMEELNKASKEKAAALLTDDQKAKWTELTGAPFTGEITFGGRGGPGGGGRGQRGEGGGNRPARPATE